MNGCVKRDMACLKANMRIILIICIIKQLVVNVGSVVYLCCRVEHKEGAELLYAHLRLCVGIENTRYVRLLCSYLFAVCRIHIGIMLVLSRNVLRYSISVQKWLLLHVPYSLITWELYVSYSLVNVPKAQKGYVPKCQQWLYTYLLFIDLCLMIPIMLSIVESYTPHS